MHTEVFRGQIPKVSRQGEMETEGWRVGNINNQKIWIQDTWEFSELFLQFFCEFKIVIKFSYPKKR